MVLVTAADEGVGGGGPGEMRNAVDGDDDDMGGKKRREMEEGVAAAADALADGAVWFGAEVVVLVGVGFRRGILVNWRFAGRGGSSSSSEEIRSMTVGAVFALGRLLVGRLVPWEWAEFGCCCWATEVSREERGGVFICLLDER